MTTKKEKEKVIEEIAGKLFAYVPSNKLPQCCIQRAQENCQKYGACGEVLIGSFKEALSMVFIDDYEAPK